MSSAQREQWAEEWGTAAAAQGARGEAKGGGEGGRGQRCCPSAAAEVRLSPRCGAGRVLSDIFTSLGRRRRWRWRRPGGRRRGLGDKREAAVKPPEEERGAGPTEEGPRHSGRASADSWEPAQDPQPRARGTRTGRERDRDRGEKEGQGEQRRGERGEEREEREKEGRGRPGGRASSRPQAPALGTGAFEEGGGVPRAGVRPGRLAAGPA